MTNDMNTPKFREAQPKEAKGTPRPEVGKVYLVGGGPGDPALLTLKGADLIRRADVIVYDRLVHPNLLIERRPDAEMIDVGKRPHDHPVVQAAIDELLVERARAGKTVVRLKGGDPFVFGRGGEEGEILRREGIPFEVVPGITSAIGGLACAGIPVTFRGEASSFHVITAHRRDGSAPDFKALAKLEGTLVFLMGFERLDDITEGLRAGGKDPETPAAVVMWAATPRQKTVTGTLSTIGRKAREAGLAAPVLICVGDVVRHQEALDFTALRQTLPFYGKHFLLFRQGARSEETLKKFRDLGGDAYAFPTVATRFRPSRALDDAIARVEEIDWLFFTSANGVDYFMSAFLEQRDIRDLAGCRILVVGSKTGEALARYGLRADQMPDRFLGREAAELLARTLLNEAASDHLPLVLAPRSAIAPKKTMAPLESVARVLDLPVYDLFLPHGVGEQIRSAISDLDAYYAIFTSSSTFRNLQNALGEDFDRFIAKAVVVSIGPTCSGTIRQAGFAVDLEADTYTVDGIIEKIMMQIKAEKEYDGHAPR